MPKKSDAAHRFANDVRLDAARFAEATDDVWLDFEEFYALQPEHIRRAHSPEEIRVWFDLASEGAEALTVDQFFRFSLSKASEKVGASALRDSFKRWDRDRSGYLDAVEFAAAVTEMGYGSVAHTLFKSLDTDNSGAVTYEELEGALLQSTSKTPGAKALITSLVWQEQEGEGEARTAKRNRPGIDTSKWVLRGKDVVTLRNEMQQLLNQSGAHVADVIQLFDRDSGMAPSIDDVEFYTTLREQFGYKGSKWVIDAVFASLDTDQSGEIGYDELFEFLRGRRHPLDERNKRVRDLRLEPPNPDWSLEEIVWNVETLRILTQQMLQRARVGPHDLLAEWAMSRGRNDDELSFTRREYLNFMQGYFLPDYEQLWLAEVEPVVSMSFHAIVALWKGASGSHLTAHVDLVRFERWLNPPTKRASHLEVVRKSPDQLLITRERQQKTKPVLEAKPAPRSKRSQSKATDEATAALHASWRASTAKLSSMRHVRLDVWREEESRRARRLEAFVKLSTPGAAPPVLSPRDAISLLTPKLGVIPAPHIPPKAPSATTPRPRAPRPSTASAAPHGSARRAPTLTRPVSARPMYTSPEAAALGSPPWTVRPARHARSARQARSARSSAWAPLPWAVPVLDTPWSEWMGYREAPRPSLHDHGPRTLRLY